jgi:hypothetical protein
MAELQQLETAPATSGKRYRRVIDLGVEGANPEIFEADALEELVDKFADAHLHGTRKIREQAAELRGFRAKGERDQAIENFVATHPDYENDERNAELMRMKLAEMGLSATSENLHKVYLHLKERGFLELKGEEAHSDAIDKAQEPERIAQPTRAEPIQQRTKKASGISTQSSRVVPPASTEPSLEDAYELPMDKLKLLANRQMRTPGW